MSAAPRAALLSMIRGTTTLAERARRSPLDHVLWTPPQLAILCCVAHYFLLRTGNQFGKTWVGAAEIIYRCLGRHPYKVVRPGPIEAWVICKSWSQSIAIQQKLWALLPKDELDPRTQFDPGSGFVGVQKVVRFANGSIIRFKTVGQDTLDLESATIHYVWIDEPLGDEETFAALQMRLRRTGGDICITMTPATTGDLMWLRKMVEAGTVVDLHYRMEPQNFIPVGSSRPLRTQATPEHPDGQPMDEAWVDKEIERTAAWQRGVRCHGEWEYALTGRTFPAFDRNKHVIRDLLHSGLLPGIHSPAPIFRAGRARVKLGAMPCGRLRWRAARRAESAHGPCSPDVRRVS